MDPKSLASAVAAGCGFGASRAAARAAAGLLLEGFSEGSDGRVAAAVFAWAADPAALAEIAWEVLPWEETGRSLLEGEPSSGGSDGA